MSDQTPSIPTDPAVAVALVELRGTMAEGFATVNGSLALVAQRTDQTVKTLEALDARVTTLERARWPLPSVAAVLAVSGFALSAYQFIAK